MTPILVAWYNDRPMWTVLAPGLSTSDQRQRNKIYEEIIFPGIFSLAFHKNFKKWCEI